MRGAHAAAAYKGWLTKEVQEAIADPRPSAPHAKIAAEWKVERPALAKQAKSEGKRPCRYVGGDAIVDCKGIIAYIAQDNQQAAIELGDMLMEKSGLLNQQLMFELEVRRLVTASIVEAGGEVRLTERG